jgi:hypothetical protein
MAKKKGLSAKLNDTIQTEQKQIRIWRWLAELLFRIAPYHSGNSHGQRITHWRRFRWYIPDDVLLAITDRPGIRTFTGTRRFQMWLKRSCNTLSRTGEAKKITQRAGTWSPSHWDRTTTINDLSKCYGLPKRHKNTDNLGIWTLQW